MQIVLYLLIQYQALGSQCTPCSTTYQIMYFLVYICLLCFSILIVDCLEYIKEKRKNVINRTCRLFMFYLPDMQNLQNRTCLSKLVIYLCICLFYLCQV